MNKEFTLAEYQTRIDNWVKEHGGYWSPLSMLSAIMEELGELAREINHLEGFKPKKSDSEVIGIGQELADILFSLSCMANYYKIDLSIELDQAIRKFSERDKDRFNRV
jgi:NTP pyrophosphatase (non-canonical NTP hydrolase)